MRARCTDVSAQEYLASKQPRSGPHRTGQACAIRVQEEEEFPQRRRSDQGATDASVECFICAPVAQLDRVLRFEEVKDWFESSRFGLRDQGLRRVGISAAEAE